jgi:hypothetical protein
MPPRALRPAFAAASVFVFAGCASAPLEQSASSDAVAERSEGSTAVENSEPGAKREVVAAATSRATIREELPIERRPASVTAERETESARPSESRRSAAGGADSARLAAQLDEATRELATLRAAQARAGTERARPAATREVVKPEAADEKLSASLKSYAQFKHEMAVFFTEMERVKKENAELGAALKSAEIELKDVRASVVKIEGELRAEKRSRTAADESVAQLRDQLRAIGRALAAAGLSAEKLAADALPSGRLETNEARLRAQAGTNSGSR